MKKVIYFATAIMLATSALVAKTSSTVAISKVGEPKWEKSTEGTWEGAKKTWYKLNTKDASLWTSKDGKKWDASKDGMWQDKEGKWLKIVSKDLKWSADGGKTWSSVPEWKWEGADSKWYKFDKEWNLWTTKA